MSVSAPPELSQPTLLNTLLQIPLSRLEDAGWRISLVGNLDNVVVASIPRSLTPAEDLRNIVAAAWSYRDPQGRSGLVLLLDAAIDSVQGSYLAGELGTLRAQAVARLNDPGFAPQPAPLPSDQFIEATCQAKLRFLDQVTPAPEDRAYL